MRSQDGESDNEKRISANSAHAHTLQSEQPLERPEDACTTVVTVDGSGSGSVVSAARKVEIPQPIESSRHTRYDDEGEVGRGGMCTVRRVHDRIVRRRVAMKVLERDPDDIETAARFLDEAQITGQLDHPNIVPVYELVLDSAGVPEFFTMKLVRGVTLADHRRSHAPEGAELEVMLQALLKVCDAVSFAHARGVIHRDLKPENIMLGNHGQVYLMDWGVAKLTGDASHSARDIGPVTLGVNVSGVPSDEQGRIIGTIAYMAPEQALGDVHAVDARTDVFGLGGVLYHILVGRPTYPGSTAVEVLAAARAGRVVPPQARTDVPLPPALCDIAMKALALSPANRFQTVLEFREALAGFLRGGGWFETRFYDAGQVVVVEGDPSDAGFIIVRGRALVFRAQADGTRDVFRELGPGDVFGETGVFTRGVRTATVEALEPLEVKVVTERSLDAELRRNEWMAAFVRALAERFVELDKQR